MAKPNTAGAIIDPSRLTNSRTFPCTFLTSCIVFNLSPPWWHGRGLLLCCTSFCACVHSCHDGATVSDEVHTAVRRRNVCHEFVVGIEVIVPATSVRCVESTLAISWFLPIFYVRSTRCWKDVTSCSACHCPCEFFVPIAAYRTYRERSSTQTLGLLRTKELIQFG